MTDVPLTEMEEATLRVYRAEKVITHLPVPGATGAEIIAASQELFEAKRAWREILARMAAST